MRTLSNSKTNLIEQFIVRYKRVANTSPTIREIANGTNIPRPTVARYLKHLKEQGSITYSGHRNISLLSSVQNSKIENMSVPILGYISCGLPKLAEENIEDHILLPTSIFGEGNFFILHASGDSMIEANIFDDDLVLIKQQNFAETGQIVAALINDEVTLKRFYPEPEKKRIRLQPENSTMY